MERNKIDREVTEGEGAKREEKKERRLCQTHHLGKPRREGGRERKRVDFEG